MKINAFPSNPDLASFILRISIGLMFLLHGIGKVAVVGMATVNQNFLEKGFPIWSNYIATTIEILAGMMLMIGIYVRSAALVLLPISLGILVYHFPNGWVFQNPGGGWEYPQLILIGLIAIFLLGAGKYSLDHGFSQE